VKIADLGISGGELIREFPVSLPKAVCHVISRTVTKMADRDDSELGALLRSILIVEDEALVRLDTAESLREDGYRVHEAANASEAVGLIESKFAIDLLFTDINLGKGMNGVELAVWALVNRPDVRAWLRPATH
jgi:response regulator RpfG family c-di-GMP phosphodiesterase